MKLLFSVWRSVAIFMFAYLNLGAWAQLALPEMVVTASRFSEPRLNAPASVQVITQEDIQNSGAMSIPDALRMLSGVNIRSSTAGQLGMNSSVDLGGFGVTATQNTLILVDGRRLNPIDASEIVWAGIPLSSITRIEVASGSAAVQYGAGATGGVIHIITDGKKLDRTLAELRVGSFGTALLDFNLDRQIDDLSVSLNAEAARSDGWRENSQASSNNISTKISKTLSPQAYLFAELLASQQINGFPGGVVGKVGEGNQQAAKFNNVGSQNTVNQSGLRLGGVSALSTQTALDVDLVFGKKTSNFTQPYYDTADSFNTTFGIVTGAGANRLDGEEISFSPKLRTEFSNGVLLVYGYDFSKSTQNGANTHGPLAQQVILANQGSNYFGNILSDQQSVQLVSQSLYLISRIPLNPAWDLSLGGRRQVQNFDSYDLNKSSGIPQRAAGNFGASAHEAALNYKLSDTSRTYLRVNQSYRFANTDEYWGFDSNGNRAFSGELRPQITKAYELGYDFQTAGQNLSLMLAQSVTQDEIRYNPAVFQNANLTDNIFRTSLSANGSTQVLLRSRLTMGVRFQRAEYLTGSFAGQSISLVPNVIYNLGWLQELDGRTHAGIQAIYVGKQNYDASPDSAATLVQMPAYTTVDAFWKRIYGKLETRLTVKNLLGSTYASYGGFGSVSIPGGNTASSYYYFPSDPRSLFVSMIYRF
jgi:iron complex outermembrane receptor protein